MSSVKLTAIMPTIYLCQNTQKKKDRVEELINKLNKELKNRKPGEFYDYSTSMISELGYLRDKRAVKVLLQILGEYLIYNNTKTEVIIALGKIGDVRAVGRLIYCFEIRSLGDPPNNINEEILKALDIIGKPAVTELIAAIKSNYNHDRSCIKSYSIQALGRIKDNSAVPFLIELLNDKDYWRYAFVALGGIGDKRAIVPLLNAIEKAIKNHNIGIDEIESLGGFNDERVISLLVTLLADEQCHFEAQTALTKIGKKAVPAVISAVKNGSDAVKERAIEILGRIKDDRAVFVLIPLLKDKYLKRAAADALGKIGSCRAVPSLIQALTEQPRDSNGFLGENEKEFRKTIVYAFEKINDLRCISALIEIYNDDKSYLVSETGNILRNKIPSLARKKDVNNLILILNLNEKYWSGSEIIFKLDEVKLQIINSLEGIALDSGKEIKSQILNEIGSRLGVGLFAVKKETDPKILERLRQAYNKILESMKDK